MLLYPFIIRVRVLTRCWTLRPLWVGCSLQLCTLRLANGRVQATVFYVRNVLFGIRRWAGHTLTRIGWPKLSPGQALTLTGCRAEQHPQALPLGVRLILNIQQCCRQLLVWPRRLCLVTLGLPRQRF